MLDHAIILAEHDINDVDCELKMDFKVLIPGSNRGGRGGESAMFMNFIEIGHNHLLKHPLCESFLYLKWLKAGFLFVHFLGVFRQLLHAKTMAQTITDIPGS